jgi:hypothetical protein
MSAKRAFRSNPAGFEAPSYPLQAAEANRPPRAENGPEMSPRSHSGVAFGCIADRISLLLFSACLGRAPGFAHDPLFSRCRHFELVGFFPFVTGDGAIGPEPVFSLAGVQERQLRRKAFAGAAAPAPVLAAGFGSASVR